MELDAFSQGQVISTGVLDLVDLIPSKYYRRFNPNAIDTLGGATELPFPNTPGGSDGAFPEPRFCIHYVFTCSAILRTLAASSYMDLTFTTSVFGGFPDPLQTPVAFVPWIGQPTTLTSLARGNDVPGETQTGRFVVTSRTLMVTAAFGATNPGGNFSVGVYASPVLG
jgi:hypothetical protein